MPIARLPSGLRTTEGNLQPPPLWSIQGVWRRLFEQLAAAGGVPEELSIDSTHIKVHRSARGSKKGTRSKRSVVRAGRSHEQEHALADDLGRPVAFTLTPGDIADISVAQDLLETLTPAQATTR